MYHRILVPLEGSTWAERALPHAIWLSRQSGAELILVQVVPSAVLAPPQYSMTDAEAWLTRQSQLKKRAERYLADVVQRPELHIRNPRHLVLEGPTAETLVQVVERLAIDVVVLTTRGRRGLKRWLLGSVADHLVQHVGVPVLLVRVEE